MGKYRTEDTVQLITVQVGSCWVFGASNDDEVWLVLSLPVTIGRHRFVPCVSAEGDREEWSVTAGVIPVSSSYFIECEQFNNVAKSD